MNNSLLSDLQRIVGSPNASSDPDTISRYAGDALGVYRAFRTADRLNARPAVVAWPLETSHVSEILRYAQMNSIPVVPYGGGTGVMGAAAPIEGCITLNMQRMSSIIEINPQDMLTTLQPGVILETAAQEMAGAGLTFGHDPWSRPIATVGGAISTNSVGYTAAKHGAMGDQVVGLEAVLPDGETVRTRNVPITAGGPDLKHLFIGSEGTFGVITEVTVKAFPASEKFALRSFDFPSFENGFWAVAEMYGEGLRPTMVDYGEEPLQNSPSTGESATVYLAFDGFAEDVDTQLKRVTEICRRFEGVDGDPAETQRFWETRHSSGESYRKNVLENTDPDSARKNRSAYRMDYLHVALPVSKVLEYRRQVQGILDIYRVQVREWSLWARPELFSFLIVGPDGEDEQNTESMAVVVDKVLGLAQEMGGSMEYCHGVGLKLSHLISEEMQAGLSVVQKLKSAIDPGNLLNPGKLTL